MNEMMSLLESSQDDEVVGLEVKMGVERNFARYLDSEGRHEEAKEHWREYYRCKRDYDKAMEKYLTDDELFQRVVATLNVDKVDTFLKEHPDYAGNSLEVWNKLSKLEKEKKICYLVATSKEYKKSIRIKATTRFNEIIEKEQKND